MRTLLIAKHYNQNIGHSNLRIEFLKKILQFLVEAQIHILLFDRLQRKNFLVGRSNAELHHHNVGVHIAPHFFVGNNAQCQLRHQTIGSRRRFENGFLRIALLRRQWIVFETFNAGIVSSRNIGFGRKQWLPFFRCDCFKSASRVHIGSLFGQCIFVISGRNPALLHIVNPSHRIGCVPTQHEYIFGVNAHRKRF